MNFKSLKNNLISLYDAIVKKILLFCTWFYRDIFKVCLKKIDEFLVKYFHKGLLKKGVFMRYLTKELFMYFFVAFLFFFMIFFVNQILYWAETILKQRAPAHQVAKLMLYALPGVISQSAPFATLVGFLMCLGRLMTDNEILILRASGHSYITVLIPVLTLGMVISIFSFIVNDYLLPLGNQKFEKLKKEIIVSNPTIEIEANSIKRLNNATLVIGDVKNDKVSDLVLFDSADDGTQRIIISRNSMILPSNENGILMQLTMDDSKVVMIDKKDRRKYDVLDSDITTLNIFDSAIFSSSSQVAPREMTAYDLKRRIDNLASNKNASKRQLNSYRMEYYKKFSVPFGSIFFAILALPLALIFGKHNGQTIGLIIGLFICLIYWALMLYGQIFSLRQGWNGFWTMWFPDMLIGGTGLFLYIFLRRR